MVASEAPTSSPEPGESLPEKHQESVAVLPFTAMSSGEDDGYFADGLTEEILNSLAQLPELLVTARTSSFHFKEQNLPVQEIAKTLGVDHIVEGSVRRSGKRVRITAQLIRADDGFHLWSDTYDRTLEDVFAVQENIAANIAETLDVVLNEEKREMMRQAGINDVQAFIDFQRGRALFNAAHSTDNPVHDLPEANLYFDRVLERVPNLTDAQIMRSDLYGHIIHNHAANINSADPEVLENALSEIFASLDASARHTRSAAKRAYFEAEKMYFSNDWSGIPAKLDTALGSNECYQDNWVTTLAGTFGRTRELIEHYRRLLKCDPLSSLTTNMLAYYLIWAGNPQEAFAITNEFLQNNEFDAWIDDGRFVASLATGHYKDIPESYGPNPDGSNFWIPRAVLAHAMDNNLEQARALYQAHIEENPWDDQARILAGAVLGDRDLANRGAAAIDARFAGPFMLAEFTKGCVCGAPFDLDVTPNFKARIEQAGFEWPPAEPLKFPAKDW